ncbi:EAL domain-containing protein [Aquibacillus rhizosphaerae]|uniref:EAL domain-containing protein n=1 Tax=Aquibacillus rhizosphaerae TaxID=3051431 RepID=A0ABT7L7Q2_9BACI|nr:EAL domain-containing protein [Aquibacillus sp. LR5S19]MDL4841891.1 EAL domain-containing protein [Aquibacillus sp. LR5S19]
MDQENFFSNFETAITLSDFLNTIDTMGVGLSIVDANLEDLPLVHVNEGFTKMTGYEKEEVLMKNCRFLQGEGTDQTQVGKIRSAINEAKSEAVTLKNYRKDGSYFWNQFVISPIVGANNKVLYYIGFQFDVTKQIEDEQGAKQKIRQLSDFDQLTGLIKLDYFKDKIQLYINDYTNEMAIIRVNLNRFRNINNSYGEQVSDYVLVEVANRLSEVFPHAPITRSFADDFIILHNQIHSFAIKDALLAVESKLEKPYLLEGEELTIDFSIGISQYPENGKQVETLLAFAALAMREAKKDSLLRHRFFNDALAEKLETRMSIEKRLVKGLEKNEFFLEYQPKVATNTYEIVGVEALIRWKDTEKGVISPGDFIPVAEETGFINELGEWVMLEACKTNKEWQDKGLAPIPVSVNVSAIQFRHPHFTQTVKNVLKKTGLQARYLELEITETLLIEPELIIEKLNELKREGISVSIDDFGTGYSSINYLKELPIDTLKIDRAFIKETPHSERDNALLLSVIQLGKSLGLTVLVEGVEIEEQVYFLSESDCDHIQGFYFSRPLGAKVVEEKLSFATLGKKE